MKYEYVRCLTNEERHDIGRQVRKLKQVGIAEENIFLKNKSRMKADRAQFNRLLSVVQFGDEIVKTEVSRLISCFVFLEKASCCDITIYKANKRYIFFFKLVVTRST